MGGKDYMLNPRAWRYRFARSNNDIPGVLALIWLLIAIGLVSLVIPSGAQLISSGWAAALTVLGAGLFLAGAATVTGSLVGFMFGVPRVPE